MLKKVSAEPRLKRVRFGSLIPSMGTNNFVAQQEDFAVMMAYFENGQGQFGLIYDVVKGIVTTVVGNFQFV